MNAHPVVLLHAFPLQPNMWAPQIAALEPHRQVLAPPFPGFGGRPPGEASLDHFADAVMRDVDAAGLDGAVFVGLSMGGYVAFRIWERFRDRVRALVLADTRAGPDDEAARARRTEQAERVRREGVEWMAEAMVPGLLGETVRRSRSPVVATVESLIGAGNPEGVARALEAMRERPDSRPLLGTIDVPTLVLVGDEDPVTPPAEAKALAEGIPGSVLEEIPQAGHLSNMESPESFNEALMDFLGIRAG